MHVYLSLMRDVLANGEDRCDRTGVGVRSVFGRQIRVNLADGFPLLTTKRVFFDGVVGELLWFLSGSTNVADLQRLGVHIWDHWAPESGDLGPIYGAQWRSWRGHDGRTIDQLAWLIDAIRSTPYSRRLLISAWNVADLPDERIGPQENARNGRMALAPCHCLAQFRVSNGRLSCLLYQRSADLFIGVPFNIASYALLTHLIAQQCDLDAGDLVCTFGDLHLYHNHITDDIVYEQLRREPRPLPRLVITRCPPCLFEYRMDDIALDGYNPHPAIRAPVAV